MTTIEAIEQAINNGSECTVDTGGWCDPSDTLSEINVILWGAPDVDQALADEISHSKYLETELAVTQVQLISAKALLNLHCSGCALGSEHQSGCLIGKLLTEAI